MWFKIGMYVYTYTFERLGLSSVTSRTTEQSTSIYFVDHNLYMSCYSKKKNTPKSNGSLFQSYIYWHHN